MNAKRKRHTLRRALERIERETRGYYYLSAQGAANAIARDALRMPLDSDTERMLQEDHDAGRI
jgi:hypothetical protein